MTDFSTDIPFFDDDFKSLEPVYLYRTELERYTVCPFMAHACDTGKVLTATDATDSGSEAHDIIAEAVADYARDGIPPREFIERAKFQARADVQPDVVDALRRATYTLDRLLTGRSPKDLMLFDGGEGSQSGQLAVEILQATDKRGPVFASSELDLLVAGPSVEEVHEYDWKTGRTVWTATDVATSFQFRKHAFLVFETFPQVQRLVTRVYMTRMNEMTPPVVFKREYLEEYAGYVHAAAEQWWMVQATGKAPCWPRPEKCAACPAVHLCPVATAQPDAMALESMLNDDPEGFVAATEAVAALLDKRRAMLRAYVDANGDIIGDGVAFGLEGPKRVTKPRADQYKAYQPEGAQGDD